MKIPSLLLTAAFVGPASMVLGQVQLSNITFSYSQNFNTLGSATTPASQWNDNSTILGWYSNRTTYFGGTGSDNTGNLYSFGSLNSGDRALGSVTSGSPTSSPNPIAYGVRFKNSSSVSLNQFWVGYTGEQWRDGGNNTQPVQTLSFAYKAGANLTTTDLANDPPNSGWNSDAALNFQSPISSGSSGSLNGGLPANRTVISDVLLSGVIVAPGEELFLRWKDNSDFGNDHGLAIDDLNVSWSVVPPVPETATPAAALALGGLLASAYLASAYRLRQARRCC